MKTTIALLSVLFSSTLASPVATAKKAPTAFGLIAARSGSPIHLQAVNATGEGFWIGKETSTYCPKEVVKECPPGTETVLTAGGSGLDTEVPGGQQVYVAPTGALSFTQAHSGATPPGSAFGPFHVTAPGSNGLGTYTFTGLGATGFIACPAGAKGTGPFKVFANIKGLKDKDVPGGHKDKCLGFDALTVEYKTKGAAAWQYE